MKTGWVMGWAVPQPWFATVVAKAFPDGEHVFFEPTNTVLAELEAAAPFDRIAGYSLGAHLLLAEAARADRLGARVVLLAPFLAFPAEDGSGGRVARTQVRYLSRWVRRERETALADFYERAGLDIMPAMADGILLETLMAGLVRLESGRAEAKVPPGWRMYAGAEDRLLDAAALRRHLPELSIVAGATHHPQALLKAWQEAGL